MNEIKTKITDYLADHPYLRLGTVNANCDPQVHTVGFVSEGCVVYFVTDKNSRNLSCNHVRY